MEEQGADTESRENTEPPAETFVLGLIRFDGNATFRWSPGAASGANPVHDVLTLTMDRDRFNALGKPGYLEVSFKAAQ